MDSGMLRASARGNYTIEDDEHAKITRLILTDIGGKHLVGAYPWAVHGRQGAYQAAHRKFKSEAEPRSGEQESEAIDVFSC